MDAPLTNFDAKQWADEEFKTLRMNGLDIETAKNQVRGALQKNGWNPDEVAQASGRTVGGSAVSGAAQGLATGLGDEIGAGIKTLVSDEVPEGFRPAAQGEEGKPEYSARLAATRKFINDAYQQHPVAAYSGDIVGSAAPIILTGGLTAPAAGAGLGKRMLTEAATGAVFGGVRGFGEGEEGLGNRIGSAATGAATGAVLGAAMPPVMAGLGKIARIPGKAYKKIVKGVPRENVTKGLGDIKPWSAMSEAERVTAAKLAGAEVGKPFTRDLFAELSNRGMKATNAIDELTNIARTNRKLYNQLTEQVQGFNYGDDLIKAAKSNIIPNAPFNKVNQILSEFEPRLQQFTDNPQFYVGRSGKQVRDMAGFNADIKNALRNVGKLSPEDSVRVDNFLNNVEVANMKQNFVNSLTSQSRAKDTRPVLLDALGGYTRAPIGLSKAASTRAENRLVNELLMGGKINKKNPAIVEQIKSIIKKTQDPRVKQVLMRAIETQGGVSQE